MSIPFAVVTPDASAGRRSRALRDLLRWLGARLDQPPTVVCWQTGPMAVTFGPDIIDAGAVNEHWAPQALAAARLAPAGRALKNRQLRRLLEPLADCDRLLLGGASTLPLLDWLSPRPSRRVGVWIGDDELDQVDRAIESADALFVAGDQVAAAVAERGVDPRTVRRVAEPLIEPPATASTPAVEVDQRTEVAVVGSADEVARSLPAVVTARGAAGASPRGVVWLHPDERQRWDRWVDARFGGLETTMTDRAAHDGRFALDEVCAVVLDSSVGSSGDGHDSDAVHRERRATERVAVEAALAGVPVLARVGPGGEGGDATLRDRLALMLTDPTSWADASAAASATAQAHRVDLAGRGVIDALGLHRS